ncbi:MAG: alpha/beta hydrolase [Gammaproteobacteria bacterium]|nr:alpha/beta hydrolase [Gammaproteobacteria bacterium]
MSVAEPVVPFEGGVLSAAWTTCEDPVAQLVLTHGAGAGFQHSSMVSIAEACAKVGIVTLRFNFPFIERGASRVDAKPVAMHAIREAVALARHTGEALPLFLGGHSFGGRMASHAVVELGLDVRGLVFCSFPLHPAKKPSVARARHLPDISVPMLFLSGTRDALADRRLLQQTVQGLPQAELHWLETADHSYKILKRTRSNPLGVFDEMAKVARRFMAPLL